MADMTLSAKDWRPGGLRCDRCDNGIMEDWSYCPFCGYPQAEYISSKIEEAAAAERAAILAMLREPSSDLQKACKNAAATATLPTDDYNLHIAMAVLRSFADAIEAWQR